MLNVDMAYKMLNHIPCLYDRQRVCGIVGGDLCYSTIHACIQGWMARSKSISSRYELQVHQLALVQESQLEHICWASSTRNRGRYRSWTL